MIPHVWNPAVWWASLWVGALLVTLSLWVLAGRDGRNRHPEQPAPQEPALGLGSLAHAVSWTPELEPMGPVSGWPHTLGSPDAPPVGSPDDRPDLWATLP